MTRISSARIGPTQTARPGSGGPAPGGGAFSLPVGDAALGSARLGGAAPAGSLDAMLALQEVAEVPGPDKTARDKAGRDGTARRHGQALLQALAELHRSTLAGNADPAMLERLAGLATVPEAADPDLNRIVRAIACRAAVELARRRPAP